MIRRNLPQSTELPELTGPWIEYPDLTAQFSQVLEFVGGECHVVDSVDEIPAIMGDIGGPDKVVVSGVPNLYPGRCNQNSFDDPHALGGVDLAVMPGQLAVAENAAVWVNAENVRHRAIYFICQHLALVVPQQALVPHLHAAYERIQVGASPFGCFISGPSKTADIEQSLVKGAHGARTLKVFLTRN